MAGRLKKLEPAFKEIASSGIGAGLGLGVSVLARVLVPPPLFRLLLTAGGVAGTFWLPATPLRHALQGTLVVSAVVDIFHLKARITDADAPRGGVGALEAELSRATPWGVGEAVLATRQHRPLAAILR